MAGQVLVEGVDISQPVIRDFQIIGEVGGSYAIAVHRVQCPEDVTRDVGVVTRGDRGRIERVDIRTESHDDRVVGGLRDGPRGQREAGSAGCKQVVKSWHWLSFHLLGGLCED